MGVPLAIIIMIALMMTMFAMFTIIIFKNHKKFNHESVDYPSASTKEKR